MTRAARWPWLRSSAAVLAAAVALTGPAAALDAAGQRRLTALVRQDCGSCHGMTLQGGLGRALLPNDIAHIEADGVAQIILHGIPGTPMPPWRGLLSEAEALWIAEQLKKGFPNETP